MTAGEGGMVTTSSADLATRMKSFREFGKVQKGILTNWHESWGYNWRMPEISALLAFRQLLSLDDFIARRQEIAAIYDEEFSGVEALEVVRPPEPNTHNYFKYIVILKTHDRLAVHKGLLEAGITPSGYVYEVPLHKQPVFPAWNKVELPRTEYACQRHLCLPIFVGLPADDARTCARELKRLIRA